MSSYTERYHNNEAFRERVKANRRRRYRENNEYTLKGPPRPRVVKVKGPTLSRSEIGKLGAAARWSLPRPEPQRKKTVPAEIRAAYRKADENSQIKRLCPTWADLEKRFAA